MKRVVGMMVVLTVVLGTALGWRIQEFGAYAHAPSGGSGVVEGVEVNVTTRLGARLTAIHVEPGDNVVAGQLLAELECAEPLAALDEATARVAAAQSAVNAARAQAAAAAGNTNAAKHTADSATAQVNVADTQRANLEKETARLVSMHQSGVVTVSQLDQVSTQAAGMGFQVESASASQKAARARVDAAYRSQVASEAQVESARNNVGVAEATLRRTQVAVNECRLLAPRSATVFRRNYEPGEVVMPGAHVLSLVDLDDVRTTFYLPNAELAAAAPGRTVVVTADAYPGQTFAGTVRQVAAKAEFTPRNVQTREDRDRLVYAVEVNIPNPGRKLRPGMPVEVVVDGTAR
jgi:HlyD family secretion protein